MKISKMPAEEVTIEQAENEIMLMGYEIRFWKNKALRSEQQKDEAIKEKTKLELRLEKFNGITDEMIERLKLEMKKEELVALKIKARAIVDLSIWIKESRVEESILDLDKKLEHWTRVIDSSCIEEHDQSSDDSV
jgi:hypothetical protein